MRTEAKPDIWIICSTWAITILFSSQYISTILGIYLGSGDYFSLVMSVGVALGIISLILKRDVFIVKKDFFFLILLVLFYYFGTFLLYPGRTNVTIVDFIGMCLVPCFFGGMLQPHYKQVLKNTMYLMCFSLPVMNLLFAKGNNIYSSYDAITMGTSYAVLPVIMAGIVHFVFFRNESSRIEKVLYIISFVYTFYFIKMSYRGALLALFVTIFFSWYFKTEKKNKNNVIIIVSILGILGAIAWFNFNTILVWVRNILDSLNIKIALVDKTLSLTETSGLMHGRINIYKVAITGFLEKPLLGHGVASFKYFTGIEFPHNFILEFLYDGGLILAILILILLISGLKRSNRITRTDSEDKFAFIVLIASISLTRTMVSAEVWRVILFWMLMGIITNNGQLERFES